MHTYMYVCTCIQVLSFVLMRWSTTLSQDTSSITRLIMFLIKAQVFVWCVCVCVVVPVERTGYVVCFEKQSVCMAGVQYVCPNKGRLG